MFDSSKANISEYISHIFLDEELNKTSTVRKFRTIRKEGGRDVSRELEYYSLDMIIAAGYRVNSKKAAQFRIYYPNAWIGLIFFMSSAILRLAILSS